MSLSPHEYIHHILDEIDFILTQIVEQIIRDFLNTVFERVSEFNKQNCPEIRQQIDAVFLLDRGAIINFGDGQGSFQFKDPQGKSIPGLTMRPLEIKPNLLFSFVTWISAVIQRFTIYDNILIHYLMKGQMS